MQCAFAACHLPVPDKAKVSDIIGLSLTEAVHRLLPDGVVTEELLQAYREAYRQEEQRLELFPGVIEMLQTLQQRGYWLGIVTGKSRSGLLRVLDTFDLADHFLVLRTADCCPSKPHPAMVLECMDELGVQAQQTVVIGDAAFDMQMAKAAGVRAYGVSYGVASARVLMEHGAIAVFDHAQQIVDSFD